MKDTVHCQRSLAGYRMNRIVQLSTVSVEKCYWWTYLRGSNRGTDTENDLEDTAGEGEEGTNWEASIDIYTMLVYVLCGTFFPHRTQNETHTSLETTQGSPLTSPWPVGWPWGGDNFVSGLNLACETGTSFLSDHWTAKAESKYKAVPLTPGTWRPSI